ncbi:Alpha-pyrone synthesis polyketide synthase-like Pks18 [compost metagenome]
MDTALVTQLQLQRNITRIPLTFIGCAAGLKAICLSKQLITSDPEAVVLVVCVELCTLHIQPTSDRDSLFGAAFFGDGASACVVGTVSTHKRPVLQLGDTHSVLLPAGEEEMVWEVGNYGFDLYLSTNIPKLIGEWIPAEIERLCANEKTELWAIHPGGRGIVEALQQKYSLKDELVAPSLDVLREIGNVSSATILFVLEEMLQRLEAKASQGASGIALAFGPGLTAEMVNITYIPAVAAKKPLAYELYV